MLAFSETHDRVAKAHVTKGWAGEFHTHNHSEAWWRAEQGGLPSFIPLLCLASDSSVVLSSRNGCQEEQEARQPSTPVFQKDSQCSVFRF